MELLFSRLLSTGAHKGIMISTSDYQGGAIEFANVHGIKLIKAQDYDFIAVSHSAGPNKTLKEDPFNYIENNMPPYEAFLVNSEDEEQTKIYPTKNMWRNLFIGQNRRMKGVYGIDVNLDLE